MTIGYPKSVGDYSRDKKPLYADIAVCSYN